jgi:hypothetical protein
MAAMWGYLNDLFHSTAHSRRALLGNQYTNSVVFDNFQLMIQKKWQMCGSSSNYLKGVVSIVKKDKAILLLPGSVLRSPSGDRFRVRSARFVNEYLTIIEGEKIITRSARAVDTAAATSGGASGNNDDSSVNTNADNAGDPQSICANHADTVREDNHADTVREENTDGINLNTDDVFLWPQIGWDVISINRLVPTLNLSYATPIVPPPLNACCRADATTDDLLFSGGRLCFAGGLCSRPILSDEYNQLILDSEDVILLKTQVAFGYSAFTAWLEENLG